MNTDLKLKSSGVLSIARVLVAVLTLVGFLFLFLSLYDPRTEEQKLSDANEAFLAESTTKAAVAAVKKVNMRYPIKSLEGVSVLSDRSYVLVTFIDGIGMENSIAYNCKEGETCSKDKYIYSHDQLVVKNMYFNKESEVATRFSDANELDLILKEARK